MKKFTKVLFFALVLSFIPLKQWAQTPYRQYANDGILLNFHEIENVDFRVFLLYTLNQDNRFELIANEGMGQFSITSSNEADFANLSDAFETFFRNAYTDFSLLSKADIYNQMSNWKSCIPSTYFVSMMMDIIERNNRPNNDHCINSAPFCTSDQITFAAANTSQTADDLEGTTIEDGCIYYSYNPSWYHMRINDPGQFIIHMEGHDPSSGTERDIDFCIWGPFNDPTYLVWQV